MARFEYDVFLSHSSADQDTARALAERLRADGLRVWFDAWEVRPGDLIGLRIEQGLETSRTLVFLMSRAAFASEWATLERHTILFRDPSNAGRRFLPVRIDDSEPPGTIAQFAHVDWRDAAEAAYQDLLAACRGDEGPDGADSAEADDQAAPLRVVKGHTEGIMWLDVSPDGRRLVTASEDHGLRVWDTETWECLAHLVGHEDLVRCVAFTPDGQRVVSCAYDDTVKVWDVDTGVCIRTIREPVADAELGCYSVAVTRDGKRVLVGSRSASPLEIWEIETGDLVTSLPVQAPEVYALSLSPDGSRVAVGTESGLVEVWDVATATLVHALGRRETDADFCTPVLGVTFCADGKHIVSASPGRSISVWDANTGARVALLEGHTSRVYSLAVTADGRFLLTSSAPLSKERGELIVWDMKSGSPIRKRTFARAHVNGIGILPRRKEVVTGHGDGMLRIWAWSDLVPAVSAQPAARYTNAKVVLVGESGVGKTGLAVRLAHDRWEVSDSTHGMEVYRLDLPRCEATPDIDHEVWLWDFAGQPDYRLIHQLYMDETAVAVLVFDPQQDNPFEELLQWDRIVGSAARRAVAKILVAGRCDRGGATVSHKKIERFCEEHGYAAYIPTAAKTREGHAALLDAMAAQVPWDTLPWTSSTRLFKLLKDAIVRIREDGLPMVRLSELRQRLQLLLPGETVGEPELRAVVGLLVGQGLIQTLDFGDFVLLEPAWLNRYASAVVKLARTHADEIGCVPERQVLEATIDFGDMARLGGGDEPILLRAMTQTLIDRSLCLREETAAGDQLVFPSYFNRDRPTLPDHPSVFVTYGFQGDLDKVYATLVVRLSHTEDFVKDELWKDAVDFTTHGSKRVGLVMKRLGESAAEITIYFEPGVPSDTHVSFIKYVHEHLLKRAAEVTRVRHYVCPHCDAPVEGKAAIRRRLDRGQTDVLCVECEKRVPLMDMIEEKFASDEFLRLVRAMDARASINIDNESRELILVGHAFAIAGEAGQIFRPTPNSDWGIDGEIEFKDDRGEASGHRLYLQLKSGDSYLHTRQQDGSEIFRIKNPRHARYWQNHAYPVMLVVRGSDGGIRWMDVSAALRASGEPSPKQIVFDGQPLTALNLVRMRDRVLAKA